MELNKESIKKISTDMGIEIGEHELHDLQLFMDDFFNFVEGNFAKLELEKEREGSI